MVKNPALDEAVSQIRNAVNALVMGDSGPQKSLWSHEDDVTLANPFGGFAHGWHEVEQAIDRAAASFESGNSVSEEVARVEGSDIGYLFEIEHFEARLAGGEGTSSGALRVTMIFRLEEGEWRLVHRQADPLTTPQSPERSLAQGSS